MSLDVEHWYAGETFVATGGIPELDFMFERPPSPIFTHPLPYGAICTTTGVQFVVFSRSATAMRVLLYDDVDDREPIGDHRLRPGPEPLGRHLERVRAGHGAGPALPLPGRRARSTRTAASASTAQARLIDPYAKALAGHFLPADDGIIRPPKCVVIDDEFDWQGDRHLRRDLSETIIYEMHVRGFTRSPSSGVEHPGTYLGVIEKIPYLQSLGVTAVELMPVHEFPIHDCLGQKPDAAELLGLRPAGLLRPAPRLRRRQRAGRPGPRVQGDGPGAAPGRHRGDPRRRLQPHGRGQRAGADPQLQGAGEPRLLHARKRRPATTGTTPAAATRSTATTRSSAS